MATEALREGFNVTGSGYAAMSLSISPSPKFTDRLRLGALVAPFGGDVRLTDVHSCKSNPRAALWLA